MRRIKFLSGAIMCGMLVFTSCDKENELGPDGISNEIYKAFDSEFPGARNVEWKSDGTYAIASFDWEGSRAGSSADNTAWFELSTSKFVMAEHDMPFAQLNEAIQAAFRSSKYATWKVDEEVDVLKRLDKSADPYYLYVIEVENKQTDEGYDLYYAEDGLLVKEVPDAFGDNDFTELLPSKPAGSVENWLQEKYPGARIVDLDNEDGGIEVEFIYNKLKYEALLSVNNEWIYTKIDYNRNTSVLPAGVVSAINQEYPSYVIDDVEFYESVKGNFYSVEIENDALDHDMELFFDKDGNKTVKPDFSDSIGGGLTVDAAIQNVLDEKYPKAVVLEKDYDDGLLELEIRHDGVEKDVYFNGRNEWVRTEYELTEAQLPEKISNFISDNYSGFRVEDAGVVELPSGMTYEVEIESGNREYKLFFDKNGTFTKVIKD